jgi:hypothetical protein
MNKKSILAPVGVALAALVPQAAQAKAPEVGASLGQAVAITRSADASALHAPLLALPNDDSLPGSARHHSHYSHTSHRSHHSHYSGSGGGGHYSHSSHSSHSSHYSSS